jgi:hypothetical protein
MYSERAAVSHGYSAEIDNVDRPSWGTILTQFDDASIHQTWAAGEVLKGARNVSHLVLRYAGRPVAVCQVTVRLFPVLKLGIADVYNGPLWRRKDRPLDIGHFYQMVRCLTQEYAVRRSLLLRIWPNEFNDQRHACGGALEALGFRRNALGQVQRTLLLDLTPSLESLRKNLGSTWRLHLNRAEKSSMCVDEGTGDGLYQIFLQQLNEMMGRKGFVPQVSYDKFRAIQAELPDHLKMRILVASLDGQPMCSIVYSAIGTTGTFLFGATSNDGLKSNASNLLHWRALRWLKDNGRTRYDLGGIDPVQNPGTYQFKRGLGGKLAEDRTRLGEFHYACNFRSRLLLGLLQRLVPLKTALQTRLFRRPMWALRADSNTTARTHSVLRPRLNSRHDS